MSYKITVLVDSPFEKKVDPQIYEKCAVTVLEVQELESGIVSLVFTDEEQIRHMNQTYAGLDEPTDVLSFPSDFTDPESGIPNYGDVIIAVPVARRNADKQGHALENELAILVVHGVLHLLGFDHGDEEEKATMWGIQSTVLTKLGFSSDG